MGRAGSLGSCIMNATVCCKQLSSLLASCFFSPYLRDSLLYPAQDLYLETWIIQGERNARTRNEPIRSASTWTELTRMQRRVRHFSSFLLSPPHFIFNLGLVYFFYDRNICLLPVPALCASHPLFNNSCPDP